MIREIIWTDEYSVGVEAIDAQHRELTRLVNEIVTNQDDLISTGDLSKSFAKFLKLVKEHFQFEEKLLSENNYPDYEKHLMEHNSYAEMIAEFIESANQGQSHLVDHFILFLHGWWRHHVLEEDMKYKQFLNERDIR